MIALLTTNMFTVMILVVGLYLSPGEFLLLFLLRYLLFFLPMSHHLPANLEQLCRMELHTPLFNLCPGLPGWVSTRGNIHPLTPILITRQHLSISSIYYDPQHPPCSIYVPDSPFPQPLSRSSLVFLLVWAHLLHTPCISSPSHHL